MISRATAYLQDRRKVRTIGSPGDDLGFGDLRRGDWTLTKAAGISRTEIDLNVNIRTECTKADFPDPAHCAEEAVTARTMARAGSRGALDLCALDLNDIRKPGRSTVWCLQEQSQAIAVDGWHWCPAMRNLRTPPFCEKCGSSESPFRALK